MCPNKDKPFINNRRNDISGSDSPTLSRTTPLFRFDRAVLPPQPAGEDTMIRTQQLQQQQQDLVDDVISRRINSVVNHDNDMRRQTTHRYRQLRNSIRKQQEQSGPSVSMHGKNNSNNSSSSSIKVQMSIRFLFLSTIMSLLFAYGIGRLSRVILCKQIIHNILISTNAGNFQDHHNQAISATDAIRTIKPTTIMTTKTTASGSNNRGLPPPIAIKGQDYIPKTTHTTKNFDSEDIAVFTSGLLVISDDNESKQCDATAAAASTGVTNTSTTNNQDTSLSDGSHILIDMKNVDYNFLNSDRRLANAIVELCAEIKLTLLSYHCHSLQPAGVTCVGIMPKAHISFHTWPEEGIITLDLYTSTSSRGTAGTGIVVGSDYYFHDDNNLVPIAPVIERLFGIPRNIDIDDVETIWSHQIRGSHELRMTKNLGVEMKDDTDLLLEDMGMHTKKRVVTKQTNIQQIDVYDAKSSFASKMPHEVTDRIIYLDGVLQSSRLGEKQYHETLVQPAMFAHPNPKRVGILGGGEGGTLREVLKHNTIEEVIMIDIDGEMIDVSKQYIPEWSDCSFVPNKPKDYLNCFDDPRAKFFADDALAWYMDRYSSTNINNNNNNQGNEKFDILIMDLLDPQYGVEFADALYNNKEFFQSLFNALNDDNGILVAQLGNSPEHNSPPDIISQSKNRHILIETMKEIGFKSINSYEDGHFGFYAPWSFMVAFKGNKEASTEAISNKRRWYSNEAEIELEMHKRSVLRSTPSTSSNGEQSSSLFHYFDGSTMLSFQNPHRVFENTFCKQEEYMKDYYSTAATTDGEGEDYFVPSANNENIREMCNKYHSSEYNPYDIGGASSSPTDGIYNPLIDRRSGDNNEKYSYEDIMQFRQKLLG